MLCPICGEGEISYMKLPEVFKYKGYSLFIPKYPQYSCKICGESLITAKDMKKFESLRVTFRQEVDKIEENC